jgi:short subunit dehydrogenase-like uncharacterized protein
MVRFQSLKVFLYVGLNRNAPDHMQITHSQKSSQARNSDAIDAKIALIPGCGFDVVPTDCLAKMLHNELPTATHLAVALWGYGGAVSQGTSKSALRLLSSSRAYYSRCRKDGKIVEEEIGARVAAVQFATDHKSVVSAPLPDVSSAYYSTGIINISGYLEVPPSRVAWIKSGIFRRLLDAVSFGPLRWITDKAIEYFVSGPSDEMRKVAKQEIFVRGSLNLFPGMEKRSDLL